MPRPDPQPSQLDRDLAELKLLEIAQRYREVLDEAARQGSSMLEVLNTLVGMELAVRQQRALERRLRQARLPKQKTLADYDFSFPKRIPKTAILRLFDCDFIPPMAVPSSLARPEQARPISSRPWAIVLVSAVTPCATREWWTCSTT